MNRLWTANPVQNIRLLQLENGAISREGSQPSFDGYKTSRTYRSVSQLFIEPKMSVSYLEAPDRQYGCAFTADQHRIRGFERTEMLRGSTQTKKYTPK